MCVHEASAFQPCSTNNAPWATMSPRNDQVVKWCDPLEPFGTTLPCPPRCRGQQKARTCWRIETIAQDVTATLAWTVLRRKGTRTPPTRVSRLTTSWWIQGSLHRDESCRSSSCGGDLWSARRESQLKNGPCDTGRRNPSRRGRVKGEEEGEEG